MQHTQNYQLSRWEKDDRIMMEDFNADNEAIDAALAAKADAEDVTALAETVAAVAAALGSGGENCRIAWGTYTGTGTFGYDHPNILEFDFSPAIVWVGGSNTGNSTTWPATFIRGATMGRSDSNSPDHQLNVSWGDHSVSWYASSYTTIYAANQCNAENQTYYYVAIGYDNSAE